MHRSFLFAGGRQNLSSCHGYKGFVFLFIVSSRTKIYFKFSTWTSLPFSVSPIPPQSPQGHHPL